MNPVEAPASTNPQPANADSEHIPLTDRLMLWMLVFGFVLFAVIILGDLLLGVLR